MWVVIAWREAHKEPIKGTGRPDLGRPPEWRNVTVPRAVVWVMDGEESDIEGAADFMAAHYEDAKVFTYPRWEGDPLARARRDIMR